MSGLVVPAALAGCGLGVHEQERCDPEAIAAFEALPSFPGVDVDVQVMRGQGCADLVQPDDPAAFLDHFEASMREAGWTVASSGPGVFGVGPDGGVSLHRVNDARESNVFVRVISPEALAEGEG